MKRRERRKTIRKQKRKKKNKDGSHCCSQTKYTCIICDKCCLKGFLLTLCIVLVSVEHKRIRQATTMLVQVLIVIQILDAGLLLFYHKMMKHLFVLSMDSGPVIAQI